MIQMEADTMLESAPETPRLEVPQPVTPRMLARTGRDRRVGVLLLTSSLERGGAERQVIELANNLDPNRFRTYVCSLSNENPLAPSLRDADQRLFALPKRSKYDVSLVFQVMRLMRRLRIKVVHTFMFDAEIVGRLAGRLAGLPAVVASNRCPHFKQKKFKLWLSRLTAGCYDMMVANSWAGRNFEKEHQGVPDAKLRIITNGVDIHRFRPRDAAHKRRELGLPPDALVVGMFAHFRGNKNHLAFIDAAGQVLQQVPNAVFLCAGSFDGGGNGVHIRRAREAVAERGLEKHVWFLGERSDMAELYNVLDLKVLSSFFEGTPNVVLEAMASGLPVIATDVSDNGRIVAYGETGYLVPSNDSDALARRMLELLTDDDLRQRFGAAARRRAETEFSVQALAAKTANVYLDILRRKEALH